MISKKLTKKLNRLTLQAFQKLLPLVSDYVDAGTFTWMVRHQKLTVLFAALFLLTSTLTIGGFPILALYLYHRRKNHLEQAIEERTITGSARVCALNLDFQPAIQYLQSSYQRRGQQVSVAEQSEPLAEKNTLRSLTM